MLFGLVEVQGDIKKKTLASWLILKNIFILMTLAVWPPGSRPRLELVLPQPALWLALTVRREVSGELGIKRAYLYIIHKIRLPIAFILKATAMLW